MVGDQAGQQRTVVNVTARAAAHPPFVNRLGQILIALYVLGGGGAFIDDDDARSARQPEPGVVRRPKIGRHPLGQRRRPHRLQQPTVGEFVNARDIDGQHHIGGRVPPLRLKSLGEPFFGEDNFNVDIELFSVSLCKWLN